MFYTAEQSTSLTNSDQIKTFFSKIRIHGRLNSGYRQVIKAVERGEAKLVFLANDCNEANYKNLINALCKTKGVAVCTKFKRAELGELAGQYKLKGKIDEQRMGKVHLASSAAIVNFGKLSEEEQKDFNALIQ